MAATVSGWQRSPVRVVLWRKGDGWSFNDLAYTGNDSEKRLCIKLCRDGITAATKCNLFLVTERRWPRSVYLQWAWTYGNQAIQIPRTNGKITTQYQHISLGLSTSFHINQWPNFIQTTLWRHSFGFHVKGNFVRSGFFVKVSRVTPARSWFVSWTRMLLLSSSALNLTRWDRLCALNFWNWNVPSYALNLCLI
jgi:hypothetical protein